MARVLVTGAGGFIGRGLGRVLAARGHDVVPVLHDRRRPMGRAAANEARTRTLLSGEIAPETDWTGLLGGLDIVVHLAQRAHRRSDATILAGEPAAAAALARAAARAGIRRFCYMSSIKAMGETTAPGMPFRPGDAPHPADAYGRAKLASERALADIAGGTGIELVVLRPPLVYGPEVGGNFRALARLAGSGVPLPFAAIDNRRSLIFRDNLIDLVVAAMLNPSAAGQVLLAADDEDFSTPALIRLIAEGQGRPARLFPLAAKALSALGRLPGLGAKLSPLIGSLQVDAAATIALLGWTPPIAARAALLATARSFNAR